MRAAWGGRAATGRGIAFRGLRPEAAGTRTEDWEKNGLNSVRTKVFVTTDAPLEEVEAAVADAEASCTVRSTIADPPAFETEVVLEKPEA